MRMRERERERESVCVCVSERDKCVCMRRERMRVTTSRIHVFPIYFSELKQCYFCIKEICIFSSKSKEINFLIFFSIDN